MKRNTKKQLHDKKVVFDFNQTDRKYDTSKLVHEIFQEMAFKKPGNIALTYGELSVTYEELDKWSNKIANFLYKTKKNKQHENIVAIMQERTPGMIASIFGILKSGGAYLPIDVKWPKERIIEVMRDSGAHTLLINSKFIRISTDILWDVESLNSVLCIDNADINIEDSFDSDTNKFKKMWDFVATSSERQIEGGGWVNSYTRKPFTLHEVEEIVENVYIKIQPYINPSSRILEIGCGSGLILERIAPNVGLYVGTDISEKIIQSLKNTVNNRDNIRLHALSADKINELPEKDFDVVIVNSVSQFFPDIYYLNHVLDKCSNLLKDTGVILISDVRDKALEKDYYISLGQHNKVVDLEEFSSTKKNLNTELFIPRDYFLNLSKSRKYISSVIISPKIGKIDNELTRYRYDSLLKIDKRQTGKEGDNYIKAVFTKEDIDVQLESLVNHTQYLPSDIVYVIYTSGSTGKPKGVMIEHGALLNRLFWMQRKYPLEESDSLLLKTPYTFDVSVWEIFWWSITGSRLSILKNDYEKNPVLLLDSIRDNSVSVIHFVPSMFAIFLEYLSSDEKLPHQARTLKQVFTSGEELKPTQLKSFAKLFSFNKDINLANLYGPTEATIDVSYYDCSRKDEVVPIGRPIDNTQIYILDDQMNPVDVGQIGELYISGDGLARGYLNNPELTKKRFIKNPFIEGKKMYKTGDLAKFLPNGNIVYLGRNDFQVKIRGIRIELGEIENTILNCPGVTSAIVLVAENLPQDLVVYYSGKNQINNADFKKYLSYRLPTYMIPEKYIYLKKMPLSGHGKIDRKQILSHKILIDKKIDLDNNEDVKSSLIKIWNEVLSQDDVVPTDNFFERGGHSMKVVEAVHKINARFKIDFGIGNFFNFPVLMEQIKIIEREQNNPYRYYTVSAATKKDSYRLSHAQKRLWFLYEINKNSFAYNVAQTTLIRGHFNISKFEIALNKIIERHQIFRTNFVSIGGEPRQIVHNYRKIKINKTQSINSKKAINAQIKEYWIKPFVLEKDNLIKVRVIKISREKHIVVLVLHHIICDGRSLDIINNEISFFYNALINNIKDPVISDLKTQVSDYAEWENSSDFHSLIDKQKKYWTQEFNNHIFEKLSLPEDEYVADSVNGISNVVYKRIPAEVIKKIEGICTTIGVTNYVVFMSTLYMYLNRISGQDTIILGMPISARLDQSAQDLVGLFANTIAAPLSIDANESVLDILLRVKNKQIDIQNNQYYPFDLLVKDIGVVRSFGDNPLFRVTCTEYDSSRDNITLPNTKSIKYRLSTCPTIFDLNLSILKHNSNIEISMAGDSSLFSRDSIKRIAENFIFYLGNVLSDMNRKINDVPIVSVKESNLLNSFNHAFDQKVDEKMRLHDLLINSAKKYPNNIAIKMDDREISYKDLDVQTSLLANYLISVGIRKGSLVPIIFHKGVDVFVVIYALFKIGAAYIPIDPAYPPDRIRIIIDNSRAEFLILEKKLDNQENIFGSSIKVLVLSDMISGMASSDYLTPSNTPKSSGIAYVIYTSGSTGKPKGVMCTHTGVINSTLFGLKYFGLSAKSKILQAGNLTFDTSVWEMNMSIGCGGTLILIPEDILRDPEKIVQLIQQESVTFGLFIPTMLSNLDLKNTKIKRLVSGGEEISPVLARKLMSVSNFYNAYGPTETSICATVWKSNKKISKTVPIGKPLPNTRIKILDRFGDLLPIGSIGEIYISGQGLASGYLNDQEKTEKAFVLDKIDGKMLYKTGDLGKWLPDGNLIYKGRIDNQVKIRGYRIELSEIESTILEIEGIRQTVVLVKKINDIDKIVAYCVRAKTCRLEENHLRVSLQDKLPIYMVPESFIFIDFVPQKVNGKIDYEKIMQIQDCLNPIIPDSSINEHEANILNAWKQVGGISKIQVNDDFFRVGGHSIMVLKVLFELKMKYGYGIGAQDFYNNPTARLLANFIVSKKEGRLVYDDGLLPKNNSNFYGRSAEYKFKTVLVTGATGYLGAFLIKELLKTECEKIYTLVRADNQDQAKERVYSNLDFYFVDYDKQRIIPIIGDIEKDNCGLSDDFEKDVSSVNLIIHAAANTSHIGFEDEFVRTNILGTKNILNFAYKNKSIRVCIVSTLSVSGDNEGLETVTYTEDDFDVGQKFSNIYEKTKFESEKIARHAIKDGLDVFIVRLGNLVGGPIQKNPRDNYFYQYLAAIIATKHDWNINIDIDISPVDISAAGIIGLCKIGSLPKHTFHLFNSDTVLSSVVTNFINQLGWKIKTGSGTISKADGQHSAYLTNYLSNNSKKHNFVYTDKETKKILPSKLVGWPKICKKVIEDILNKMKKNNLI